MTKVDILQGALDSRARLLLEAAHASGVPAELCGQQLERDLSAELRIFSQVDFAHPAHAEFGEDAVMGDEVIGGELFFHLLPSAFQ
jgi:hypothetical protein